MYTQAHSPRARAAHLHLHGVCVREPHVGRTIDTISLPIECARNILTISGCIRPFFILTARFPLRVIALTTLSVFLGKRS